jgi:hypothetical protein
MFSWWSPFPLPGARSGPNAPERRGNCFLPGAMKPAQIEALTGTGLLMFSAFRRGPLGILAFLGAAALIVHAAVSRTVDAVR